MDQLLGGGVAVGRIFFEAVQDDGFESTGEITAEVAGCHWGLFEDHLAQLVALLVIKRCALQAKFIKCCTE